MNGTQTIALVDVDAAGGVDPSRLRRAMTLAVRRMERGRYSVAGRSETHYVDLVDRGMERCDCADFTWRQVVCQHLLACLLREGDERVVAALAHLVETLHEENRRLRAAMRGRAIVVTRALRARVAEATGLGGEELDFARDRDGDAADVRVISRATGEMLGRVTRLPAPATFVREPRAAAPRVAA